MLIRERRAITDLDAICAELGALLGDDPATVELDEAGTAWLSTVLDAAADAERLLLPRRMQRALDQMRSACETWAEQSRRAGREQAAVRWVALATAAAGSGDRHPDPYALAEAWLGLVRPRLDAHRRRHRRARYVLLRDIDAELVSDPLDLDTVERECSGLLEDVPLAERVRACILGLPGEAPATPPRASWGMARSTRSGAGS